MIDSKMKRAIAARTLIPIIIGDILFWLADIADILVWLAESDVSKHRFWKKKRAVNHHHSPYEKFHPDFRRTVGEI